MEIRSVFFVAALALLVGLSVVSCGQAEGERCEIRRDCQDGLICEKLPDSTDGVCRSPNAPAPVGNADAKPNTSLDSATPPVADAAVVETGFPADAPATHDSAVPPDAALSTPDAAARDASPSGDGGSTAG